MCHWLLPCTLPSSLQPQLPDRPATPASTHDNSLDNAEESTVNTLTTHCPWLRLLAAALTVLYSRASSCNLLEANGNPIVRCALCCRRRQPLNETSVVRDTRPSVQASHGRGASLVFNGDHLATLAPVSTMRCENDTGSWRTCFEKVSFRSRSTH
ncbi:hypothetical protein BU25DRAFT_131027 [Macroventuria anomochaeta]|uniref:Uncharacterized protein n=1 Tax=Macroventuria anomochaeta TaxID=301207 RepID=A0ACB6RSZ5_9PLEO|nr:uncharacterized protein BU25DRAFT_131027 [Macroventuria anomochaeta]KAF2625021.1 hypothetical protein BU25DRAFT_131027 [Macroventuria anomochaeta]